MMKFIITLLLGFFFGTILLASQAFSWFRIQEMFHFKSFYMFGLLFSAIATSAFSIFLIKRFKVKTIQGKEIEIKPKKLELKANIIGGLIFGIGWAISGACSAPVYLLVGFHWEIGIIVLSGALIGTVFYGFLEQKLPKN